MAVALRPLTKADQSQIYAWRLEPVTQRYNPLEPLSYDEYLARVGDESSDLKAHAVNGWRSMVELDGVPVGTVSLKNVSPRMGYGEVGYAVSSVAHGRGVGTEAVRLWVSKIFAETALHRLVAYVATDNTASWKLLERLGWKREGVLREHYLIQGKRVDEFVYGLLRSEWRILK